MSIIFPRDASAEQLPHYELEADLDGRLFRLIIDWIERAGRWYLSIETAEGVRLLSRKKLVIDSPLLRRHAVTADWPDGELGLFDTEDSGVECGYDDLGRRCLLVFVPTAELDAPPDKAIVISL